MFQFLSINFFSWISSVLIWFFKSSRFLVSVCILGSEVEKVIKEMGGKRATRGGGGGGGDGDGTGGGDCDDNGNGGGGGNVPKDVLKLLTEHGFRTVTQLFNSVHETGEWPKDFSDYKDYLREEAKSYETQRPSYSQLHNTYSKNGSDDAKRKDGKEDRVCAWGRQV